MYLVDSLQLFYLAPFPAWTNWATLHTCKYAASEIKVTVSVLLSLSLFAPLPLLTVSLDISPLLATLCLLLCVLCATLTATL